MVVGYDMRPSSPELVASFSAGVTACGLDVVDIGLASTDELYFASGRLGLPGAMFTASHNPAQYNGIKLCRAGAAPIGQDSGLAQVRTDAEALLDGSTPPPQGPTGSVTSRDLLDAYADYLVELADVSAMRPLTVVVDAGNGMARPHRADGVRAPADHAGAAVLRARRHLPEPRGEADRAGEACATCRPPCASTAPTSAWPSTATPTGASPLTSAASWSARPTSPRSSRPASWPSTPAPP